MGVLGNIQRKTRTHKQKGGREVAPEEDNLDAHLIVSGSQRARDEP